MRSFAKLLLTVLFLITVQQATAQDSTPVLSGVNIETGVQVYEYIRDVNGEETVVGRITETIERKQDSLLVIYKQEVPRMVITDSLYVHYESFQPISYLSQMPPRERITVDYTGTEKAEVRVKRRSFGVSQDTSFTASFDTVRYDAHWIPTLIYASQNGNNDSWSIPIYSYNFGKDVLNIKNEGEEVLTLNGQEYDTMKYEIGRASGIDVYYYWIGKDSKRLIQTRGDESEGTIVWLRIKAEV